MKVLCASAAAAALALAAVPAMAADAHPMLVQVNQQLAAQGANVRATMAEYVTTTNGPEFGRTIFASDRGNKQLDAHWVPGDDRRFGTTEISWINDTSEGAANGGLTAADTQAAIERAMQTWQDQVCSTMPLYYAGSVDFDLGYVQWLLGFGGVPGWAADLTHAGWLPPLFFDLIAPDGSTYILGVTFTFVWVDDVTGEYTDINNDGKDDVAFREIYYNNAFPWAIDGHYDVETIALHEAGHGLSQAHFGDIFRTPNGKKVQFAPYAVMNAAYSRVQHTLKGTDKGGHCSIWGNWPNK
jgi:hypothetical protein